jgi:hypothetical protein
MKFISKNANLRIVLSPGIQANQLSGIAGKPGVYVKFQDGVSEIREDELIEKMRAHPGFNLDFIAVDDDGEDPFAHTRAESEPAHVIQELKYGQVESKKTSITKQGVTDPHIKKLVDDLAMKKVNEMLPQLVEDAVRKMMEIGKAKADAKAEVEESHKDDSKNAKKTDKE